MRRTLFLALLLSASALLSCNKKEEPLRTDYIKVWLTNPDKTVEDLQIPFDGTDDGCFHVQSNVDFETRFMDPPDGSGGWFHITSVENVEPGHLKVSYTADSMLGGNSLDRRTCKYSVANPSLFLGKFLSIRQGYSQVYSDNFDDKGGYVTLQAGMAPYTTPYLSALNVTFYDYVSLNVWAESSILVDNINITMDVTVEGGAVVDNINRPSYRINVPLGTGPSASNMKWFLLSNQGQRLSDKTRLTFSVVNPSGVTVRFTNLKLYKVSEAEIENLADDEEFNFDDDDWI